MPPAQLGFLAARGEPLARVLADRLQHPEALVRCGGAGSCRRATAACRGRRSATCLGRLERAAAAEDGQAGERALLFRRRAGRGSTRSSRAASLARIGVPAALEQVEPLREALEDLRRGEDARARGGELERERQVVEAAAELGDRLVRLEPRALAEELDRLGLGQRRDRVLDLAADAQQLAARDEQLQVRAALEQLAELGRRLDHLLEVVEQQQQLALADVLGEAVLRARASARSSRSRAPARAAAPARPRRRRP